MGSSQGGTDIELVGLLSPTWNENGHLHWMDGPAGAGAGAVTVDADADAHAATRLRRARSSAVGSVRTTRERDIFANPSGGRFNSHLVHLIWSTHLFPSPLLVTSLPSISQIQYWIQCGQDRDRTWHPPRPAQLPSCPPPRQFMLRRRQAQRREAQLRLNKCMGNPQDSGEISLGVSVSARARDVAGAWPLETDEQRLPTGRFTAVEAHLDVRLVPAARPAVLENAMKMFTSPSPGRRSSRVQAPCALWQHWCSSPLNLERLRRASACLACRSSISAGERATSRALLPGHRRETFLPHRGVGNRTFGNI
ncbi:hypothetical protein PCL_05795 [Purpureocillium lilacinum]|uniref:Uncharacterized protein n=1 Tax=Purpureocillium lilacinum TaxID=33203 RepID=A0A2U3EKU5_PURLI|nr:hypothetical protein PCL_05795 [Purpureocillium lilacinum]